MKKILLLLLVLHNVCFAMNKEKENKNNNSCDVKNGKKSKVEVLLAYVEQLDTEEFKLEPVMRYLPLRVDEQEKINEKRVIQIAALANSGKYELHNIIEE